MASIGSARAAALTDYPIVVVATNTVATALADWRAQARVMIAGAILATVVVAMTLFLIIRQLVRHNRDVQQRIELQRQRLKRFPFDKIKIDRSFVTDLAEIDSSAAIVQAVVNIAASRNMTTVAEGVETLEQKGVLRALGCSQMQGFLFSAAKPRPEVRKLFDPSRVAVAAA
jgi:sensor c-di-GMP phosphodiesterase-like protein